jgi:hypothetical protein
MVKQKFGLFMLINDISSDFSSMHTGEMLEGVGGENLVCPQETKNVGSPIFENFLKGSQYQTV